MVTRATVNDLLEAAVQAPSAMNEQPWTFVVIQDKTLLRAYSDQAKALCVQIFKHEDTVSPLKNMLEDPAFNIFYNSGR
jgi:nitroreductase